LQPFRRRGVLVLSELNSVQTITTGNHSGDFTTFMRAYQDMVFSTAARLAGNDAQAEDISQEVFLRAYQHFSELRVSPTAGGWLKTVTVNLSLNFLTRHRRRWRLFSDMRGGTDEEPEIDWEIPDMLLTDLDAAQRRELVDAALRKLQPHQRLVLVLCHFEDLTYQAIADRLACSLAKVKTDIHRARAALLVILERDGHITEKASA
jgi:RNA polymerase sigma-70 factor (ECF subfamily)